MERIKSDVHKIQSVQNALVDNVKQKGGTEERGGKKEETSLQGKEGRIERQKEIQQKVRSTLLTNSVV